MTSRSELPALGESPALIGTTFLRAPRASTADLRPGQIAIIGIPHDVTKISRAGAAEGPAAVRAATLMFEYAVTQMANGEVVDIDRQLAQTYSPQPLVDLGDLALTTDAKGNQRRIEEALAAIAAAKALPIALGGDHFVTYPAVTGVRSASNQKISYLHIDMHLDLADQVPGFGTLASGTPLRRLVEEQTLDPSRIVVWGVESFQHRNEWDYAKEMGISVISAASVAKQGVAATLGPALDRLTQDGEQLYVSTDIDVLARTFAPGTGNAVGISGLTPEQLMEAARLVSQQRLAGLDLVEVAPRWDPSGRTAGIAASYLIEILWPKLFKERPL